MRQERLGDEKRLHLVIGVKQRLKEDWMVEKLVLNDLTTLTQISCCRRHGVEWGAGVS